MKTPSKRTSQQPQKTQGAPRSYSRSSDGPIPAEQNREVIAEGIRRAAAEIDYRNEFADRLVRDLRKGETK